MSISVKITYLSTVLACLHVHFSELVLGSGAWTLLSDTQKKVLNYVTMAPILELLPEEGRLQFQKF